MLYIMDFIEVLFDISPIKFIVAEIARLGYSLYSLELFYIYHRRKQNLRNAFNDFFSEDTNQIKWNNMYNILPCFISKAMFFIERINIIERIFCSYGELH